MVPMKRHALALVIAVALCPVSYGPVEPTPMAACIPTVENADCRGNFTPGSFYEYGRVSVTPPPKSFCGYYGQTTHAVETNLAGECEI